MNAETNTNKQAPRLRHSNWAVFRGAIVSVFVSYLLSVALMLISSSLWRAALSGDAPDFGVLSVVISVALFGAPIGLPAAIIVTSVGLIFWSNRDGRSGTGYGDAARVGMKTAAIVVLFEAGVMIVYSAASLVHNSGLVWIWTQFAINSLATLGIGVVTGLAVRLVAGPANVAIPSRPSEKPDSPR